jgi:hypothetical protein
VARTWILTGSPENDPATADRGFAVIGLNERIRPRKPGKPDPYPWRFPTSPEIVLDEADCLAAASLAHSLEHVRKWPPEHWTLDFQGRSDLSPTGTRSC